MKRILCFLPIVVALLFGCGKMHEGEVEIFEGFTLAAVDSIHCDHECGSFEDHRAYVVQLVLPEVPEDELVQFSFIVVGSGRDIEKYVNKKINLGVRFFYTKDIFGKNPQKVRVYEQLYSFVYSPGYSIGKIVRIKEI